MYTHTHTHVHPHTYAHTYTHTDVHTHTQTSVLLSGPGTETGIGRLYLYNDVSDPAPFTVGQGADLDSRGSSGINFPTVNHSSYEGEEIV